MKKLFFALITSFIFVATAWGQCYKTEDNFSLNTVDDHTIDFNGKYYKHIYFTAKKGKFIWDGAGNLKIKEYVDGQENIIFDQNITTKDQSYDCKINPRATGIQFYTETGATLEKDVKNIRLEYEPTVTFPSLIDFGGIEKNSTKQLKEVLSYYGIIGNMQLGISTLGSSRAGAFSINKTTINADCKDTSEELTITFNPTELGVYSENIAFSSGNATVTLYGECSKNMEETNILEVKRISYASVRLGWKPIEGATGYRIVNTTTGISYFAEAEDTDYNVTGLKMGNTYKFVVHAMYNGATSLNHSNEVAATTKVKPGVVLEECVAYSSSGTKSMVMGVNGEINYDIKSNNNLYNSSTYKVKFTAWKNWWGVTGYPDLYMLVKLDGKDYFESTKYWKAADAGITSDPQEFEAMIPNNTVAIKFASGVANGTLDRYIENFTVYKEPVLSSDVNTLDFGEVELGESKTMKFNLTYMNATKLEATEDSRFFEITKINYTASCTQGTQEVEITFTPTDCKTDYTASLSIFNGQELAITLKGTIKKSGSEVNTIIWNGTASTEWDNRDNWINEDGSPLLCTDKLSKDLTVILPAPNSTKYKVPEGGITQYPIIPDVSTEDKFFKDRNNTWFGNQVNAGDNATATKVADKIIMEYGASLVGVETLNAGGVSRYNEAEVKFEARRTEWLLVGAIVNPFEDGSTTVTREARSGDYYLNNLPHAYMHQAKLDANGNVGWDETFSDMYKPLNNDVVFALRLPNQYGPSRLPSTVYNRRNGTSYNGTQPCLYTFNGRFANESALPTYNVTPTQSVLLTNTYPANINAYKLQNGKGTILYYDYNQESFVPVGDNKNAEINAQHGFVFTPSEGVTSLSITKDDFNNTETGHRSAEQEVQSLRLRVANEIKSVSSEIYVRLDEAKDDEANYSVDAPKIFNTKALALPDVYAIRYDKKWSCLYVPTMSESVALGINVATAGQTFKFSLAENSMPFDVILEDRQTGIKYNLSNGEEFEVSDLEVGACEGRFYLAAEQKTEDDDVTTTIEENLFGENIDIFTQASQVVITSNSNILIKKVIISDLSGRTQVYESTDSEFYNNHYIKIDMPVSAGIYTINVISDSVVKTEKIRLN